MTKGEEILKDLINRDSILNAESKLVGDINSAIVEAFHAGQVAAIMQCKEEINKLSEIINKNHKGWGVQG